MHDDAVDQLDDEFVFEPSAWDLAFALGIRVEAENDRLALDELADAMLVWMEDGPQLERLTSEAMSVLWTRELEESVREGLVSLCRKDEWRSGAEAALAELERDPRQAQVAREVVRHLALDLSNEDTPFLFCVHCVDEQLGNAPRDEWRAIAVQAAVVARRNAAVPRNHLEAQVARLGRASHGLGTTERRRAVRNRLGRIATLGRSSIPRLAAQLRAIADEPLPPDPADDDAWQVVLAYLLAEVAMPELN
jgi:hypothetical protein